MRNGKHLFAESQVPEGDISFGVQLPVLALVCQGGHKFRSAGNCIRVISM